MIDYKDYDLIWKENIVIGYKEDVLKFLNARVVDFIKNNYNDDCTDDELERFRIVRDSKYDKEDLIEVTFNDEEKAHIPTKPIAKVRVLIPYKNGFSGTDVAKYLI